MNSHINTFFFKPANPKTVSIFRVLVVSAVFLVFYERNLTTRITDFSHYADAGLLYNEIFLSDIYYLVSSIILLLCLLGIKVRLTGLVASVLLFPLIFMNTMHVSRQLILMALFCISLYPSSFHLKLYELGGEDKVKPYAPIWPVRLIQFQLSFLYFTNAYSKTTYGYLNGDVLKFFSGQLPNFLVDLSSGYLHIFFLSIPVFLLAGLTVITEYFLSIGFWFRKTKKAALFIGLIFHIGLIFIVKIAFLGFATLFLYLTFFMPFEKRV